MNPNACPYCGAIPAIPIWKKISIPPYQDAKCSSCGRGVRVSWYSLFILLIGAFALVAVHFVTTRSELWTVWIGAMVLGSYLDWKFVPVVKK